MNFLKKLMISSSIISATFAADVTPITQEQATEVPARISEHSVCGINLDKLPEVQKKLAQLHTQEAFANVVDLFNDACSSINRKDKAARLTQDPKAFLLSSGVYPQLKPALAALNRLPSDEEAKCRNLLIEKNLAVYQKDFDAFLADVEQHPGPFMRPLLGILNLIAGRGQSYTGCGTPDESVSAEIGTELFNVFERTGLLTAAHLAELRTTYDAAAATRAFLSAHKHVETLVIAGSHVGPNPVLPYDPHRHALVVNLDPTRGADVVAKITDVMPHLPTGQFVHVLDDSNFGGKLLKDLAQELFRVMRTGGTIGWTLDSSCPNFAYSELIAAGFDGVFKELKPEDSHHHIKSINSSSIHELDLNGLRLFLGEANYSKLMDEVLISDDETFVANLFVTAPLPLTEETKPTYFKALCTVYEQISDLAALLTNVQDGTVYSKDDVFKVKDGKIHTLAGFVKP